MFTVVSNKRPPLKITRVRITCSTHILSPKAYLVTIESLSQVVRHGELIPIGDGFKDSFIEITDSGNILLHVGKKGSMCAINLDPNLEYSLFTMNDGVIIFRSAEDTAFDNVVLTQCPWAFGATYIMSPTMVENNYPLIEKRIPTTKEYDCVSGVWLCTPPDTNRKAVVIEVFAKNRILPTDVAFDLAKTIGDYFKTSSAFDKQPQNSSEYIPEVLAMGGRTAALILTFHIAKYFIFVAYPDGSSQFEELDTQKSVPITNSQSGVKYCSARFVNGSIQLEGNGGDASTVPIGGSAFILHDHHGGVQIRSAWESQFDITFAEMNIPDLIGRIKVIDRKNPPVAGSDGDDIIPEGFKSAEELDVGFPFDYRTRFLVRENGFLYINEAAMTSYSDYDMDVLTQLTVSLWNRTQFIKLGDVLKEDM